MVEHAQLDARHFAQIQPLERLPRLHQPQQVKDAVEHADVVRCAAMIKALRPASVALRIT